MSAFVKIYALSDPRTPADFEHVRYVGKTTRPLKDRLDAHFWDRVRNETWRSRWIRKLWTEARVKPAIWPLSFCSLDTCDDEERAWIKRLRAVTQLTNLTDGGEGAVGRVPTAEHRARLSESLKGQKRSSEFRARCRQRQIGRKYGPRSEASRQRMSESMLARYARGWKVPITEETREKQRKARTGQKRSIEARQRMSEAQIKRRRMEATV